MEILRHCWDDMSFQNLNKLAERMAKIEKIVLKSKGRFF